MLSKLLKLANQLDQKGLFVEADKIDFLIKMAATNFSKSELIRSLKNDDVIAARKALTGMSGDDLGLTHKEFIELTNAIQMGDEELMDPNRPKDKPLIDLEKARKILGIGKNTAPNVPSKSYRQNMVDKYSVAKFLDLIRFFGLDTTLTKKLEDLYFRSVGKIVDFDNLSKGEKIHLLKNVDFMLNPKSLPLSKNEKYDLEEFKKAVENS